MSFKLSIEYKEKMGTESIKCKTRDRAYEIIANRNFGNIQIATWNGQVLFGSPRPTLNQIKKEELRKWREDAKKLEEQAKKPK